MAFGTLKADTLTHSTAGSLNTEFVVDGSAKAWVNFDGTASGAAARNSLNLSSMTDNGTGSYTCAWTSSFSAVDYAVVGTTQYETIFTIHSSSPLTTGDVDIFGVARTGAFSDKSVYGLVCQGDLA